MYLNRTVTFGLLSKQWMRHLSHSIKSYFFLKTSANLWETCKQNFNFTYLYYIQKLIFWFNFLVREIEEGNCWFAHSLGQQGYRWARGCQKGNQSTAAIVVEALRNGIQEGKHISFYFQLVSILNANFPHRCLPNVKAPMPPAALVQERIRANPTRKRRRRRIKMKNFASKIS